MQGNEKKTNTQRQKDGHVEQLASTRVLDGESAAPLSVCVIYSSTEAGVLHAAEQ